VTVLLTGETGTGKELLAQAIHNASSRADRPFVSVNVAAIPETLVEAEFFGAAPGAYTGAERKGRDGKFKSADGGTLFLDEIGDMPLQLQVKLLRVLQEREIEPLGSDKPVKVDVRIIAATNVDLEKRVKEGSFRADLYYRLNVLSIALPPLRQCIADLEEISARLLNDVVISGAYPNARITPSGLSALSHYGLARQWPGIAQYPGTRADPIRFRPADRRRFCPYPPRWPHRQGTGTGEALGRGRALRRGGTGVRKADPRTRA